MARKKAIRLTRFEIEVMEVLWDLGNGSIREIHERLPEHKQVAYTTVQTVVRRLEDKGALRQIKKIGTAFIFEPLVTRKAAHLRLIDDLLELFGGSARPLIAHLAESGKLNLEDLREIEEMISEQQSNAGDNSRTRD